jgi:hypothetical protein
MLHLTQFYPPDAPGSYIIYSSFSGAAQGAGAIIATMMIFTGRNKVYNNGRLKRPGQTWKKE